MMIISGIPWKAINTNKFNHWCLASFSKTTFLKNQFLDLQFCKILKQFSELNLDQSKLGVSM